MKYLLIIPLLVILFSCSSKKTSELNGEVQIITIENPGTTSIDDAAESFGFIALEAKEGAFMGYITKMRAFNGRLYLLDQAVTRRVFIYDTNGKHIKTIDNQGRGPKEFRNINNFEIDRVNREIIAVDRSGKKIFIYDLDGNYKRHFKVDFRLEDITQLSDRTMIFGRTPKTITTQNQEDGNIDKITFTDPEGVVLSSCLSDDIIIPADLLINNYLTSKSDGSASFAPPLKDTIYSITADGYKPRYVLSFKTDKKIDLRKIATMTPQEFHKAEDDGYTFFLGTHEDSDDYLYLQCGFMPSGRSNLFLSKKSGKILHTNNGMLGRTITTDENGIFWGTVDLSTAESQTGNLAQNIVKNQDGFNGNPIVIYYKLKAF